MYYNTVLAVSALFRKKNDADGHAEGKDCTSHKMHENLKSHQALLVLLSMCVLYTHCLQCQAPRGVLYFNIRSGSATKTHKGPNIEIQQNLVQ